MATVANLAQAVSSQNVIFKLALLPLCSSASFGALLTCAHSGYLRAARPRVRLLLSAPHLCGFLGTCVGPTCLGVVSQTRCALRLSGWCKLSASTTLQHYSFHNGVDSSTFRRPLGFVDSGLSGVSLASSSCTKATRWIPPLPAELQRPLLDLARWTSTY